MKRADIIARRRKFVIPGYGYKTLADVGFDGEWVTPYQKISNSKTGPLLVAKDWLDWPSVAEHRDVLKQKGYLPHMRFNQVVDLALEKAGLKRNDIYVTQAFHLLPQGRSEPIPRRHIDESFDRITRHEVDGRTVIALGEPAAGACRRAGVECIECIHPSARGKTVESKAEELAEALVAKLVRTKETRKMEKSENQEGNEAVMYDYDALRPRPWSFYRLRSMIVRGPGRWGFGKCSDGKASLQRGAGPWHELSLTWSRRPQLFKKICISSPRGKNSAYASISDSVSFRFISCT